VEKGLNTVFGVACLNPFAVSALGNITMLYIGLKTDHSLPISPVFLIENRGNLSLAIVALGRLTLGRSKPCKK
jgi:hypothetical protein